MSDNEQAESKLLAVSAENYGEQYKEHLLEQYKLFVESAHQVTTWRSSANNFFLALNTALISLFGIATAFEGAELWQRSICGGGVLLAIIWWRLVESYRLLNTAKFKVIHEIEEHLPLRLFASEWVERQQHQSTATPTRAERLIPGSFAFLFAVLFGLSFVWQLAPQPIQIDINTRFSSPLEVESE